jgi:hypothetical protein
MTFTGENCFLLPEILVNILNYYSNQVKEIRKLTQVNHCWKEMVMKNPWWLNLNNLIIRPTAKENEFIGKYAMNNNNILRFLPRKTYIMFTGLKQDFPLRNDLYSSKPFLSLAVIPNKIAIGMEETETIYIASTDQALMFLQTCHSNLEIVCHDVFEGYCKELKLAEIIQFKLNFFYQYSYFFVFLMILWFIMSIYLISDLPSNGIIIPKFIPILIDIPEDNQDMIQFQQILTALSAQKNKGLTLQQHLGFISFLLGFIILLTFNFLLTAKKTADFILKYCLIERSNKPSKSESGGYDNYCNYFFI